MAALLLLLLLALLCLCGGAAGDPRTAVARQECAPGGAVSGPALADNFVPAMDDLNSNVSANGFGTSAVGTTAGLNPNAVFGLGQCYRDLSPVDCKLCFAEVRSLLPKCYPSAGGRLYLDGCFGRYANYSFFSETLGPDDAVTCGVVGGGGAGGGNYTGANPRGFADAVRAALANVTGVAASRPRGGAGGRAGGAGVARGGGRCGQCLRAAAAAAARCAPAAAEGRALYTGCYLRYSTRLFWNLNSTAGSGSSSKCKFDSISLSQFRKVTTVSSVLLVVKVFEKAEIQTA
ncbi:hypothetical protein EE612_003353 [Oryza sativa]|nr:hypothetical protein EE612_003353 [Oryza sativa]